MSLHILVISDNGSFAAYLCDLLASAGNTTRSVTEVKEAFSSIRLQKPDLVIVAVEPAKVADLAGEKRLNWQTGTRRIPLIVISECPRLEAELLHVFDFMLKPLDVRRLLNGVAAIANKPAKADPVPALTDPQCAELSRYILSCTGLHFESRNRLPLQRGLEKRMSALQIDDCCQYLAYLKRHGEDRHELQKLLQFLTVGETYFFRYPSHFDALRERLASEFSAATKPIRIWSAGCSTGEEPYSIAISIMEAFPNWKTRDIKVIATDINNQSIKRAREGVYTPWSMRIAQEHHKKRYFDRVGESFIIRDEVKQLVEFSHLNLSSPEGAAVSGKLQDLDAIFCRNVLIYFSPETAARMVGNFAAALNSSGQLFLGHAETLLHRSHDLEIRRQENSFYYVKTAPQGGKLPQPAHRVLAAYPVLPELQQSPLPHETCFSAADLSATSSNQTSLFAAGSPATGSPATGSLATGSPATSSQAVRLPAAGSPPEQMTTAASRLETARQFVDAEEFDAAYQILEGLIAENPEDTAALVLKGFVLAGKGRFQEALDTCSLAIELNDLLPEAYLLKGMVLDAGDHLPEAAEEYRKALLLENDFIMPRYYMGRLHLRLGRVSEAAREFRNSITILAKRGDADTIPYSGGLTRAVCMLQLQNTLAQVA